MTAGVGYLKAEFTDGVDDGHRVPLVPEWKGNVGVDWQPLETAEHRAALHLCGQTLCRRRYRQRSSPSWTGYQTVDLSVNYAANKMVEIFVDAKNIFDEKYSEFAFDYGFIDGYYPMPGAAYYGGVRVGF